MYCSQLMVTHLHMVKVYHILTASEELHDTDLSLQVLPDLRVLLEEVLVHHFDGHLPRTILRGEEADS